MTPVRWCLHVWRTLLIVGLGALPLPCVVLAQSSPPPIIDVHFHAYWLGPLGIAYGPAPKYRMALSNPLLLEEVLIRHPKLRVYVMHAGWPMLDGMLELLFAHPQVYVDVAVINWALPRAEFHTYLKRLVEAGFGKRIMFGSDNIVWPESFGMAIEAIRAAPFLTEDDKRDIFCTNAMRFLRLPKQTCD